MSLSKVLELEECQEKEAKLILITSRWDLAYFEELIYNTENDLIAYPNKSVRNKELSFLKEKLKKTKQTIQEIQNSYAEWII